MTESVDEAAGAPAATPASANGDGALPAPGPPPAPRRRIWDFFIEAGARALALVPRRLRALAVAGPQRRIVLRFIFRVMERRLDQAKAQGLDAVVRWEIADRAGRGVDRWQVTIRDGRARASRTLDSEPSLTIKLDGPTFLELVSGLASAPALFMSGQVILEGELLLAARLQSFFRVPRSQAQH